MDGSPIVQGSAPQVVFQIENRTEFKIYYVCFSLISIFLSQDILPARGR
jgi:hypothetical protein